MIYATEDALKTPRDALPDQLERFVKAENKSFRQELNQEATGASEERRAGVEPISPSKRKHRSDSINSMDSNRASIGSEGRMEFDPFGDQQGSMETEMAEWGSHNGQGMGTAGQYRGDDAPC